jgi:large subunit ribosomal protein L22
MSKPKHARSVAENQAQAVVSNMRVSPRKLNLVAGLIRNQPASKAVATLAFSKRRIAQEVKKALESAVANAENNHQLDVDRLVVSRPRPFGPHREVVVESEDRCDRGGRRPGSGGD